MEQLEADIKELESVPTSTEQLIGKRQQLNSFLQEKAKGALVRAHFQHLRDIDAPTTFFFNLERSVAQGKQMVCLRLPGGNLTSEPAEMRRHAVDFYTDLFGAEECDTLSSDITLEELTTAVSQMAAGKAPGLDGLPADFFKTFLEYHGTGPAGRIEGVVWERTSSSLLQTGCHILPAKKRGSNPAKKLETHLSFMYWLQGFIWGFSKYSGGNKYWTHQHFVQ